MILDLFDFIILIVVIVVVAVAFSVALRIAKSSPAPSVDRGLMKVEIDDLKRRVKTLETAAFGESRRPPLAISATELSRRGARPPSEERAGLDVNWTEPENGQMQQGVHAAASAPTDGRSDWDRFYDDAAAALQSAAAFNAWASPLGGKGYRIDANGAPLASEADAPDKADIYVIDHDNERVVLPGFGLRRAQGLLTSDAGRAAEARLGWLFDIVPGTELRALSGALVGVDDWRVQRKGRLSLPLA
jgi:hypothetical protein